MLSSALSLSILTTTSFVVVYSKLPRKIRRLLEKYSLATDMFALIATYYFMGGTLTALMAGALVGLLTSALLYIANNPEDFQFLYDMKIFIKEQLIALKNALNSYSEEYNKNKLKDQFNAFLE